MDLVAAKRARRLFLEKQEKRRLLQEALGAAEHSCARKALLVYKDAEKEYPWDWELRADLWHLQMKLSRFQEALASARLVTRVQPTYAKGHLMKGRALMELRRYPEAVEAFALGLEYHPSGPALIAHFKEAKKQLVGFKRPTRRTNASRKEKKPPVEPTPSYPVLCNRFAPRKEGDGNLKLVCTTVEVKELLRGLPEELLQKLGALKHRELARGLLIDPTAKEPTDEGPPKTLAETHKLPHYAPCINLVHYFGLGRQFITDLYGSDEAGSYLSEVRLVINQAVEYFETITATARSVIVFDVDDTALSSYVAMKRLSFKQIPKLTGSWVRERKAPAIAETLLFHQYAIASGFRVVFLSGRLHDEHEDTVATLQARGYKNFDRLIVRDKGQQNCPASFFKADARQRIVEEGLEIVGCIGDQQSDLCGGNTGFEMKLPNYLYEMA